jgi:phosphoserine aminotransferase
MLRPFNFSAGPAVIAPEVLHQAAAEMLDWQGSGMSVMEMSHRSNAFMQIYEQTKADVRALLGVPEHFQILFMQGGGLAQNAIVAQNLVARGRKPAGVAVMDFVTTGYWSEKSYQEARKYGQTHLAASSADSHYTTIPAWSHWQLSPHASYVHLCTNETIHGTEFHHLPDLAALGSQAPLVIDFSSHVATRVVDWSRIGLAFGGAQKNLGPAGLTLVVVREDLLGHALGTCPSVFDYQIVANHSSMLNTPPTYAIYIMGLVLQWLKRQGGVAAMEQRNIAKAALLYQAIDQSALYVNRVGTDCRSRVNVPFHLRDESLNPAFLAGAQARGLLHLKGHKSVGGMRASLYNAMPLAGVQALVDYLRDFEKTQA